MKFELKKKYNGLFFYARALCLIGFMLILFGFLVRYFGINFFWESRFFGVLILASGLFLLLFHINKKSIIISKNIKVIANIGISFYLFYVIIILIIVLILRNSDAYEVVLKEIPKNEEIIKEIGEVKSIDLLPIGTLVIAFNENGKKGDATIKLIIKGTIKYIDAKINLNKQYHSNNWEIVEVFW